MKHDVADKTPENFEDETDVGTVGTPGSCDYDSDARAWIVSGSGANVWDDHDDFHFVWRHMRGDFIATARVEFVGNGVNPHRKLGWMARSSLATGSPAVTTGVHGDGLLSIQYRRNEGAETEETRASIVGADIVRLERCGSNWIMSVARFGEPFVVVEANDIPLADEVYLGLYVCSHEHDVLERARFRDVRIVVPVAAGFDRSRDPFASRLEILDVASGDREIVHETDSVLEAPNWTRDGAALIYNTGGRLVRFDLATRTRTPIDTGDVAGNNNDHVISFDGAMLAISSQPRDESSSIVYTVPITGGEPKRITPIGPSYLHGWSPDGRFLVFTGERDGQFDIYRIPAGGGDEERLTATPGLDDGPEYSPDGEYIYFNSVRSGLMQIWRMKPDGSGEEQLTHDRFNNWFPHVTPDGKSIAFVSYLIGEVDPSDHPPARRVYLRHMPRDGGTPRVIAYLYGGQGTMNVPSWSPDGRRLAFVSNTVPFV